MTYRSLVVALLLLAACASSADERVDDSAQELRPIEDPETNPVCFAGREDYREICREAGAPSTYAFLGACLRGGSVPYLRSGPRPNFIAYCRGILGYRDPQWQNDMICCD